MAGRHIRQTKYLDNLLDKVENINTFYALLENIVLQLFKVRTHRGWYADCGFEPDGLL